MRKYWLCLIISVFLSACSTNTATKKERISEEADRGMGTSGNDLQVGDIIFQTSTSSQSEAIQLATHSKYSHVGMIFRTGNELVVLEAVEPVKYTPLVHWIENGKDQHFVVKRLKDSYKHLNATTGAQLKEKGSSYLNKHYDNYFEWSDDRIYCSELVWKLYKEVLHIELGKLQSLKDFDLSSKLVQTKLKERYGANIPTKERVISPGAIFESTALYEIQYPTF